MREKRSASPVQWARQAQRGRSAAVAPGKHGLELDDCPIHSRKGEDEDVIGRSHAHALQPCQSQEAVVSDDDDGGDDGDALPPPTTAEPLRRATADGNDGAAPACS
uniref:DUF834 domain-containing protein n=1 Tax=Oryza meridionalis TaxID=40149 RepID=A0A0E0ELU6_9ORYZ